MLSLPLNTINPHHVHINEIIATWEYSISHTALKTAICQWDDSPKNTVVSPSRNPHGNNGNAHR